MKGKRAKLSQSRGCACITPRQWSVLKTISYLAYGLALIPIAFLFETWAIYLSGATLFLTVVIIAPIVEETMKGLPILAGYTDRFRDRLYLVVIVGFTFGSAEWIIQLFTSDVGLTYGPLLHVLFQFPLLFGYNKDHKFQSYISLSLCMMFHAIYNLAVMGGI